MTSPLWRDLGATEPVFEIRSAAHGSIYDPDIIEISTDRGTAMTGLSTSTASVTIKGELGPAPSSNQGIEIRLTMYGRTLLGSLGGVLADLILYRFSGRIAGQEVTDRDQYAARRTTTLTIQDWPALISQLGRDAISLRSEPSTWRVYRSLFVQAGIPGMYTLEAWGSTWHDVRFTAEDEGYESKRISTGDAIGKYCADLGHLIRAERSGRPFAWSHDHIIDVAQNWRTYGAHPIQRAQVLSPAKWVQPITIPAELTYTVWTVTGGSNIATYTITVGDDLFVTRPETLDQRHVWLSGGAYGLHPAMTARVKRQAAMRYHVAEVEIDILALIRRGAGTDHALVGQLLRLEHGYPVTLGHDWPSRVDGVYFAERISERITRDTWRMTLTLVPAEHVTGSNAPIDTAGQTWDTAYTRPTDWDTPTTEWETSP